jgi:hypothetical protein
LPLQEVAGRMKVLHEHVDDVAPVNLVRGFRRFPLDGFDGVAGKQSPFHRVFKRVVQDGPVTPDGGRAAARPSSKVPAAARTVRIVAGSAKEATGLVLRASQPRITARR